MELQQTNCTGNRLGIDRQTRYKINNVVIGNRISDYTYPHTTDVNNTRIIKHDDSESCAVFVACKDLLHFWGHAQSGNSSRLHRDFQLLKHIIFKKIPLLAIYQAKIPGRTKCSSHRTLIETSKIKSDRYKNCAN